MKDHGLLKYFLGIKVYCNVIEIYLSQRKYALDIIAEVGLLGAKPTAFPLEQNHKLALSQSAILTNQNNFDGLWDG